MNRSLRIKLLAVLFLTTTIALCVVGFTNYSLSRQQLNRQLEEHSLSMVIDASVNLSNFLKLRVSEAEIVSRTDLMRYGDSTERMAYLYSELSRVKGGYYISMGIGDASGDFTLDDGKQLNMADFPAYQQALKGTSAVSDPYIGKANHIYIVSIFVPVFNEYGEVTRVIGTAIDANKMFMDMLKLDDEVQTRRVAIINRNQDILFHTISTMIFTNLKKTNPSATSQIEEGMHKDNGLIQLDLDQKLKIFYSRVPGTDWFLTVSIDIRSFESPQRSLLWSTLLIVAVTGVALFVFMVLFMNRIILNRIKRILHVTETVAEGDFNLEPLSVNEKDELAALSRSVNMMTRNLRNMFEPFETFISNNQYAMIVTDASFRVVSFNSRAEAMLGYKAEEAFQAESAFLWFDIEAIARRAPSYADAINRGDVGAIIEKLEPSLPLDAETVWITRAGARFPVNVNVSAMTNPNGSRKGYVLIARDLTDYKESVRMSDRLLSIVNSAHDFIASFDASGRIFYMNQAGKSMLGIRTLDEQSNKLSDFMSSETAGLLKNGVKEAGEHGFWEHEMEFVKQSGERIVTSQTIVAHNPVDGGEKYYSTIVRDINESKRIHQAMIEAKEEADEANRAKSMFLARMSHEIRTPLNGIIGLSHLLKRTDMTDLQLDYLGKIETSSESLLQVINDILDFSKIEADKLTIEQAPFSLDETVQKICGTISVLLGHKPIDVIMDISSQIPDMLVGDRLRLGQILLNLMSNAIKFTEQGQVTLHAELCDQQDEEMKIRFRISDTGIGMSDVQIRTLFQPFVQVDGSTSRKYGGTGLGLIICKSIVETMGGELTVRSMPGIGSNFEFELPFRAASMGTLMQLIPSILMVADDSIVMRNYLKDIIGTLGCSAVTVGSWSEALQALDTVPMDSLLLDMEAEDMYGIETWETMKRETDLRGIKTILYTTLPGRDALQQLPDEWRPDAILVKPINRRDLYLAKLSIQDARQRPRKPRTILAEPVEPLREYKVLLVEDHLINQMVGKHTLEHYGLDVSVADNGMDALHMLENKRFDVILMDLHMPDLDGIETTKRIRSDSRFINIPIIALTADVTPVQHKICLDAGMNDVITKPIQPEKMQRVIGDLLPGFGNQEIAAASAAESVGLQRTSARQALDTIEALNRLDGKLSLYLTMLDIFKNQYADVTVRLRELLNQTNFVEAKRLLHSIRGSAANLSAHAVYETAGALEEAIPHSMEETAASLRELELNLFDMFNAINDFMVKNKIDR